MATLATTFAAVPALACTPPALGGATQRVEGDRHVVMLRSEPSKLSVGEFFVVDLSVCRKDGKTAGDVALDAFMPEHRHGMNFKPALSALEPGRYQAEGMMFHMPGLWRYRIELRGDGGERLQLDYRLE